MGKNSGIEWTDHTWNPWQGCLKVSPGCKQCYMYRDKKRYGQDPMVVVRSKPGTFRKPLQWKQPAKVFTCSWSDFFIEQADNWIDDAWNIIRQTPHLTYQILTKRPENIKDRLPEDWERLDDLAASTHSTASTGPEYGKPSWRALFRRIVRNEEILSFIERELTQPNKAVATDRTASALTSTAIL